MQPNAFQTTTGTSVTAVTASEMAAVDRVAVDEFGISLLQMMENAGRNLAWHVRDTRTGAVTVLAGNGGNGGGGLCAARHLANRDIPIFVVLDRHPDELDGAARTQYETLAAMGVSVDHGVDALTTQDVGVVVDALVGYGLDGPIRGTAAELVETLNETSAPVVSLDVPSGMDATTGKQPGACIDPNRIVTLALPKTGLSEVNTKLSLADIGIPAGVYESLDIQYSNPFDDSYWVALTQQS
jgi:NAD(P)H-hydrate epimerase